MTSPKVIFTICRHTTKLLPRRFLSPLSLSLSPLPPFVSDKWKIEAEEKEPVNEVAVLQPSRITSWPIAGFHMSYDQI